MLKDCDCHSNPDKREISGLKGYIWPSDTFTHRRACRLPCGHLYVYARKMWRLSYLGLGEQFNPNGRRERR